MKNFICKDVVVVDVNCDIYQVAEIMKKYDIGFIPVNLGNKIVGVLTDRDIVVKILANKDSKISGYLSQPISVNIDDSIEQILEAMRKHKIKRLLVEEDGKLVGILSLSDILNKGINVSETIREIFSLNKNSDTYITKINEFYL